MSYPYDEPLKLFNLFFMLQFCNSTFLMILICSSIKIWVGWPFDLCGVVVAIIVRDVWRLCLRAIPVVMVYWRHRLVQEATWETEHEMGEQFPSSFEPLGSSWLLLSRTKVLLSSGSYNYLEVISFFMPLVCHLAIWCSDPKLWLARIDSLIT